VSMGVHLDRPLHSVRLVAWGRADDGWWACVTWRQRVRDHGEIGFAAWVPAGAIADPAGRPRSSYPGSCCRPSGKPGQRRPDGQPGTPACGLPARSTHLPASS
jgi:hypothetical protein